MKSVCRLCQSESDIKRSHIIPRFVFDWLNDTSPGYLRNAANPNLRIQDGIKSELLCENCEQKFSKWEKSFAERVFKPLHESHGKTSIFPYDDWALKFAVSVSWRALFHTRQLGLSHFSERQQAYADRALNTWSEFLLERRKDPGPYEQHMLFFDVIASHTFTDLSPYMNRYLMRTIDIDPISSKYSASIYTKMGRIALFGVINDPNIKYWKGTKIHVRHGVLGSTSCQVPMNIYTYINERSNEVAQSLGGITEKQRNKINDLLQEELDKRPDELATSEPFMAMVHDVELSGKEAFKVTKGLTPNNLSNFLLFRQSYTWFYGIIPIGI